MTHTREPCTTQRSGLRSEKSDGVPDWCRRVSVVSAVTTRFPLVHTTAHHSFRSRFKALTCTVVRGLMDARARLAVLERGMEH